MLPAPSYTGWLRGLCWAAVLSWPRSNLSLINFPSCYVHQMAQHIPKSYSMTLYTQANVGFVSVFAFFFFKRCNEQNNVLGSLTTFPETARLFLGSRPFLELACWHYCRCLQHADFSASLNGHLRAFPEEWAVWTMPPYPGPSALHHALCCSQLLAHKSGSVPLMVVPAFLPGPLSWHFNSCYRIEGGNKIHHRTGTVTT